MSSQPFDFRYAPRTSVHAGMPHFDPDFVSNSSVIRRRYKYKHTDHAFTYREAVAVARTLQITYPRWHLCGSLALMVTGHIPIRRMSDIDFCTDDVLSIPGMHRARYKTNHDENYYHVADEEAGWCLFIHRKLRIEHGTFQGLRLQKIEDILYWKRQFNRDKDLVDLNLLEDELFEI